MKTFCALLLLGIVAYVNADSHPCDPLAANTYKKPESEADSKDQIITLDAFAKVTEATYFVTQAVESKVEGSSDFCNAATHGAQCGAVNFFREVTAHPAPGSEVGADELKFKTILVGASLKTGNAIEYHMEMEGCNKDDYIIRAVPGSEIKAFEVTNTGARKPVTVPPQIEKVLRSEYALYHSEPGSFTAYATCDGENIWLSYGLKAIAKKIHEKADPKLEEILKELKARAKKINGKAEPVLRSVRTDIDEDFIKEVPQITIGA